MTTTLYRITSARSGADLGLWLATSREDALDQMSRQAGYDDRADALAAVGGDHSDLCAEPLPAGPWAILEVTDYYGPRREYRLLATCMDPDVAGIAAEAHDPDYDLSVNARRLGHNQSAARRGIVAEVVSDGPEVYDDWQLAPTDVRTEANRAWNDGLEHSGAPAVVENMDAIMDLAIDNCGYIAVRAEDGRLLIVRRAS